jgi:hypothetical protein
MLDKIQALAEVSLDEKRSETEKDTAIAALRDLAANAETFHDRSTASRILKSIDGVSDTDSEISDHLLRLLYLVDAEDTPENNERARRMYREQVKTSSQ